MQTIDSFEEVFEVSRSMVEGLELTEILDPILFDNHKDITNALFEVYYDLSMSYLELHGQNIPKTLSEQARDKIAKKYELDLSEADKKH